MYVHLRLPYERLSFDLDWFLLFLSQRFLHALCAASIFLSPIYSNLMDTCEQKFTLNGRVSSKGKIDFAGSMPPSEAKEYYEQFVGMVGTAHAPELVKDGVFGAKMDVALVNDGPITLVVDSKDMKETTAP